MHDSSDPVIRNLEDRIESLRREMELRFEERDKALAIYAEQTEKHFIEYNGHNKKIIDAQVEFVRQDTFNEFRRKVEEQHDSVSKDLDKYVRMESYEELRKQTTATAATVGKALAIGSALLIVIPLVFNLIINYMKLNLR